jgi:hypothetical protein
VDADSIIVHPDDTEGKPHIDLITKKNGDADTDAAA